MANDKSVFKYLVCQCGYKRTDPTGKAKGVCKNDGAAMHLSENWYARITHQGKTTVKAISPRRRDAEDYIATCKVAKRSGVLMPGQEKDVTWQTAKKNCEQWWKDAVARGDLKQSTADHYKYRLVSLDAFFSDMTLLTIRKGDVMDYQTARSREGRAPVTINHEVKAIKRIYSMHVARTNSEDAPKLCGKAMDIGRVALVKKDDRKVRFLDAAEIILLLEKATTPEVKLATLISLNTGLRRSNVIELTWQEVRLSKRVIELSAEKMKNRKDHTVDIPEHLVAMLKEWRGNNKLTRFLFPDHTGQASITNFRQEWDKTIHHCGFHDVTFHTLRHTFASQFLMAGGDLSTLSEIMAHADVNITKTIYGHLSREHKKRATDQFADGFLSQFK